MQIQCECGNTFEYTGKDIQSHRLMCGDATKIEDVNKLMNGQKENMIFTDPPYGMNLDTDYDSMFKNDPKHKKTGNRFEKVVGDNKEFNFTDYQWIKCKEQFWWGADYYCQQLPKGGSWFVWDKRINEKMDKVVGNTFEICWSKQPHKKEIIRQIWSGHHGLDTEKRIHPTQKPVAICEWFIKRFSQKKQIIFDLFGGSGSTLIACEQTNRICYMIEIEPKYCDVIRERYKSFIKKESDKIYS